MDTRTVVAWDATPEAQAALDWGIEREAPRGGTLNIVRVVDNTRVDADYRVTENLVAEIHRETDREAERVLRENPALTVNTHVVEGDPCEELLRFSDAETVIVVGTEQRHGSHVKYRWSLGARLAALTGNAVAIVPPPDDVERHGVVVGIDGSALAEGAAEVAASEAERISESLVVVHAWYDPMVGADYLPDDDFVLAIEHEHALVLKETVEKLSHAHPRLTITSTLIRQEPAKALTHAAVNARLLVVGNRRIHGAERLLLGSVSHSVILTVGGPTLIVGSGNVGTGR